MAGHNEVFGDPLFQGLLRAYEKASRDHLRALVELRAYHLHTAPAKADKWRSAVLAQTAEESLHKLEDALHALNSYGWRLSPYSDAQGHLMGIEAERYYHAQRLLGKGWGSGHHRHPEGPEERVGPFTVVLKEGITPITPKPDERGEPPQE